MKIQSSPEVVAFCRSEQGFEVFGLRNEANEIEKITSIQTNGPQKSISPNP